MRVIFCGGGTAGHITPAISIAENIKERHPSSEILFIGREGGDENKITTHNGFKVTEIQAGGIKRGITIKNFETAITLLKSLRRSKEIISDFAPDVVIGTGGYVCWPVIKAAQRLGIPTAIHESNICPGLTTRTLSKKCDRVLLNFPGSEKEFKKKENLRVVGNPIRKDFAKYTRQSARKSLGIPNSTFFILSLGGSGGAESINNNVIKLMQNFSSNQADVMHIHISGKRYYESIKSRHPEFCNSSNKCRIFPFIESIPKYISAADTIICRCGAMTLSEVSQAGCVPILIPSPNVTDDHQKKNGKKFADMGAAIMIEESELNEKTLTDAVLYLKRESLIRKRMAARLKKFYNPDCLDLIYREIKEITSN